MKELGGASSGKFAIVPVAGSKQNGGLQPRTVQFVLSSDINSRLVVKERPGDVFKTISNPFRVRCGVKVFKVGVLSSVALPTLVYFGRYCTHPRGTKPRPRP